MNRKHLAYSVFAVALSFSAAHAKTTTPATIIVGGGSSLAFPIYSQIFADILPASKQAKDNYFYAAAGSGAGQSAFLGNNQGYFEPSSAANTIGYAAGTLTYGTIAGTAVDFGASDAFLAASQLTNPATGSYANSSVDGPLIQIPTIGTPITVPYNESAVGGTNALALTDAQLCGIYSGKITDWNSLDSSIPTGTPITVVYRSDSSGTSFLLTNHLAAVCNSGDSAITFTAQKKFASEFTTVPSNFVGASGSAGVAGALLTTPNSIGYLSPDYTDIAPGSPNTTTLQVASVDGELPSVANTIAGLANPGPGSTNAVPPSTLAAASNPLNWVPSVPTVEDGYPIVGYTTVDLSSCYANTTIAKYIIDFVKDTSLAKVGGTEAGQIEANGFVPLAYSKAAPYAKPIQDDFLKSDTFPTLAIDSSECSGLPGR